MTFEVDIMVLGHYNGRIMYRRGCVFVWLTSPRHHNVYNY